MADGPSPLCAKGQLNMGNFEDTFKGLLLEFLRRRGIEAVAVSSYQDSSRVESWTGCDTCGWDETVYEVDIFYTTTPDATYTGRGLYTYDGTFSDLLSELIAISEESEAQ